MSSAFAVEVRRTSELTEAERARICSLFTEVFGRAFPEDLFLRKYRGTYTGDSFHCLARLDDIAGAFSAAPFRYSFFGRECVFATAIDLMLRSDLRPNVALMRRMSQELYRRLAEAGVAFVFSCVRQDMMRFHQVIGGWRNIGPLSYYVAPVRAPDFPGAAGVLRTLLRAVNTIGGGINPAPVELPIQKVNDDRFRRYRYSFFPTEYRRVKVDGGEGVYTGRMFWELPGAPAGLALSFLIDVWPLNRAAFDAVVREIVRNNPEIDYLIYAGSLPFVPRLMWRAPKRLERPRYYLGGRILLPDRIDDRVYDLRNWNINLADTDLV